MILILIGMSPAATNLGHAFLADFATGGDSIWAIGGTAASGAITGTTVGATSRFGRGV